VCDCGRRLKRGIWAAETATKETERAANADCTWALTMAKRRDAITNTKNS
jgi:hypothetical protein